MLKSPDKIPISIIKPSKPEYHLDQPGGDRIVTDDDRVFTNQKAARNQSLINCNKPVLKGGFNPNSQKEIEEVYGSDETPKQKSNSDR